MVLSTFETLLTIAVLVLDVLALLALWRGHGSLKHKVLWTLLILMLPMIGVGAYLLWGHTRQDAPLSP